MMRLVGGWGKGGGGGGGLIYTALLGRQWLSVSSRLVQIHFQLIPIPLPILIMNKIICFVGSLSKLYSQSLSSAYTSCMYCNYLRFRGPGCHQMDDITVKSFSSAVAFSTVAL